MELEEQRKVPSEHNTYDGTEKITQSAYNIMIKEMDLDISESPPIKETVPEPEPPPMQEPVPQPEPPPLRATVPQPESPPMQETFKAPAPQRVAENPPKSNTAFWIIIGVVGFGLLMIFILAVAAVFFYMR